MYRWCAQVLVCRWRQPPGLACRQRPSAGGADSKRAKPDAARWIGQSCRPVPPATVLAWSKSEQIAHSCVIPGAAPTRYQGPQQRWPERDGTQTAQICTFLLRGRCGCHHQRACQRRGRLPGVVGRRGPGAKRRALARRRVLAAAGRHRHVLPRAPCGRQFRARCSRDAPELSTRRSPS